MNEIPVTINSEPGPVTRIERLKKTGAYALPNLFTLGNMALGFFAILSAFDREFSRAAWFIVGAIIMDMLDGRVARLVHGESAFGIEFDSMADWISFGLAPAYILYMFLLKDYGFWGGYAVAFIYALCGAMRLAKFNIMAHRGVSSKQHFSGLPIPGAAGILAAFILAYSMLEVSGPGRTLNVVMRQMPLVYWLIPYIMLGLAFLMISKVPYTSFKQFNILKPKSLSGLFLLVLVVFMIIAYPQDSLFIFATLYVASGLLAVLWRAVRDLVKKENPA